VSNAQRPLAPSAKESSSRLGAGLRYQERLQELLQTALRETAPSLDAAAAIVERTFAADGLLYIFGSGHSHMFAEEAFYRAGGPIQICPILHPPHMLHEGAVQSTVLEREPGHASDLLDRYELDLERDAMLVVSNSGVNALPVEVADTAHRRGLPVIAITSMSYASAVDRPGPRLADVADVVIDNHCPPGDAIVELGPQLPSAGPASSVIGLALLNSLLVEAADRALRTGSHVELLLSANMPGAAEHNAALVEDYQARVPHL
jgi:uncharacterized phosphosugar-binding protein